MKKPRKAVKISSELYEQIVKLANERHTEIAYLIDRAIGNFLKITIGNRLSKKD